MSRITQTVLTIAAMCPAITLVACAHINTPQENLSAAVTKATQQAAPDYRHAFVDLNDDGVDDAIVLLQGMAWCGSGGCTMLVLQGQKQGYKLISRSTVTNAPIRISQSTSHAWQNIIVHSDGGNRLMQFSGRQYPLNPSMQSRVPQSQSDSAQTVLPAE